MLLLFSEDECQTFNYQAVLMIENGLMNFNLSVPVFFLWMRYSTLPLFR